MYVRVRVTPSARKERVTIITATELEMSVREPPEQNSANKRVRKLVADHFGIEVKAAKLFAGHRSPVKMFSIEEH